jgi:Potential Queuosine, Q, salvage protein family
VPQRLTGAISELSLGCPRLFSLTARSVCEGLGAAPHMSYAPQRIKNDSLSNPAASSPVAVNLEVCRRLADWLKSREIPLDREESSLPGFSPEQIANFYLLLVAISHQTSPQGQPPLEGIVDDRHWRGWDYLFAKLEKEARHDPTILMPNFWTGLCADRLQALFRDERFGCRLSDWAVRATLINDLGRVMLQRGWKSAGQMYHAAGGRIATGEPNLLALLAQFHAYRDPVRKKIYFYLALMHNAAVWTYLDPDQLGAPVDYHEVRGHLRIGTVQICDANLLTKLLQRKEVTESEDISIRQAVHQVLMFLSESSGLCNPSQLHYLFWNVFRSCCTRVNPHCYSCPPTCSLPARYIPLALFPDGSRHCPFSTLCTSAGREPKLLEHNIVTDFY